MNTCVCSCLRACTAAPGGAGADDFRAPGTRGGAGIRSCGAATASRRRRRWRRRGRVGDGEWLLSLRFAGAQTQVQVVRTTPPDNGCWTRRCCAALGPALWLAGDGRLRRDTFDADADGGSEVSSAEVSRRLLRALKSRIAGAAHEVEAALGALDGVESGDGAIVEARRALVDRSNGALTVLDGLLSAVNARLL